MNIYNYLKRDHGVVAELFEKIISSKSLKKRQLMFQELSNELLIHAETEKATFYAALKEHEETAEIIKTTERVSLEISLLLELRTRLLSDVVTGKLDVRGAARKGCSAGATGKPFQPMGLSLWPSWTAYSSSSTP